MSWYYISASWRHSYCRRKIARARVRALTPIQPHKRKACARQHIEPIENEKDGSETAKINKMETNRIGSNDTYAKCLHCEYIHVGMHIVAAINRIYSMFLPIRCKQLAYPHMSKNKQTNRTDEHLSRVRLRVAVAGAAAIAADDDKSNSDADDDGTDIPKRIYK